MEKTYLYQDSANVPIFSRARNWNEQKEQHGLNSLSKFCNNYHHRDTYSSTNQSCPKPYIYGQQDELQNSNEYKVASLNSVRNNFSSEPNHYYQYGSQHSGYQTTSSVNNIYSFENHPNGQNSSSTNASWLHPGWNTTYSIDNTTGLLYLPQSTSNHNASDARCQNISSYSDRYSVDSNTNNRQKRCYYSSKDIGSNYGGNSMSTKEEEMQHKGNQQYKTTPLLNTSIQTKAMHRSSKHQFARRGICFNETINKINLPQARSSGEKLRENFCNISNTESNTLPLVRKAIEDTISRYRRDDNEDKCDIKRTNNTAAISTCLSKCEHVQKKYNGWYKEKYTIKSNENVTSTTLRSFENEVEKTIRILSHTIDR